MLVEESPRDLFTTLREFPSAALLLSTLPRGLSATLLLSTLPRGLSKILDVIIGRSNACPGGGVGFDGIRAGFDTTGGSTSLATITQSLRSDVASGASRASWNSVSSLSERSLFGFSIL